MKLNFASHNFIPYSKINTSNLDNAIQQQIIVAHAVSCSLVDKQQLSKYTLQSNGFEYLCLYLKRDITILMQNIMRNCEDRSIRKQLRNSIKQLLISWAKNKQIVCDYVIPLDCVHRSNKKQVNSIFKPINMVHVDFQQSMKNNLKSFKNTWKQKIEQELKYRLSDEQYQQLKIVKMVNIWLPLNQKPNVNTLTLLDCTSININIKQQKLLPYTAVRKDGSVFTAMTIKNCKNHQWVVSNLNRGDGFIFDSVRTPHSAIDISQLVQQNNKKQQFYSQDRESVEIRCIFVLK